MNDLERFYISPSWYPSVKSLKDLYKEPSSYETSDFTAGMYPLISYDYSRIFEKFVEALEKTNLGYRVPDDESVSEIFNIVDSFNCSKVSNEFCINNNLFIKVIDKPIEYSTKLVCYKDFDGFTSIFYKGNNYKNDLTDTLIKVALVFKDLKLRQETYLEVKEKLSESPIELIGKYRLRI